MRSAEPCGALHWVMNYALIKPYEHQCNAAARGEPCCARQCPKTLHANEGKRQGPQTTPQQRRQVLDHQWFVINKVRQLALPIA